MMKRRVSEARLQCRVREGVFSEHEVRLRAMDPEENEALRPDCGPARMEPYPFDPNAPVEEFAEEQ